MIRLFKWLVRIAVTLVVLAVLLVVLLVLLKDTIAKSLTERNLRANTGMDAHIQRVEVGLGTPTVNIENLKLYNPPTFGGKTFLDMPHLRVEYDSATVLSGQLKFKTLRLHLEEVHVIKTKDGRTNLDLLQQEVKKKSLGNKGGSDTPGVEFGGIETLYLTLGRVRITDERDPRNNDVIEIALKEEVGRNLKTEAEVTQWFTAVMLKRALAEAFTNPSNSRDRWRKLMQVFEWESGGALVPTQRRK
jgi:uncharacterized protein involved in outer membrane biogenesis